MLVLHSGALGDFILTVQLLARIRTLLTVNAIDVVARCSLARWLAGRGVIERALDYEAFNIGSLFEADASAAHLAGRFEGYDLVLSFMGGEDGSVAAALRRAGVRCAICVDPAVRPETLARGRHITDQWFDDLVAKSSRDPGRAEPRLIEISVSAEDRARSAARLADFCGRPGAPCVIVHPGSGGRAKCFPLAAFETIVSQLREAGLGVAWMAGPAELDWYGPEWIERLRRSAPVIFEQHVDRAVQWLLGANHYVGNDAGMTHVAAALGVSTLALFGPTDPRVWRPLGAHVRMLQFAGDDWDMNEIVGRVISEVRASLSAAEPGALPEPITGVRRRPGPKKTGWAALGAKGRHNKRA